MPESFSEPTGCTPLFLYNLDVFGHCSGHLCVNAPHPDLLEQALGGVPEEPILHLVMLELNLEMVVSGEAKLPLLER